MLREAIRRTGEVASLRVLISPRERTIALRPYGDGIVAHTLNEQQDLNDPRQLLDGEAVTIDEERCSRSAIPAT